MNLRKLAKGKPCQLRIVGICNFDPETTVLAHIRRGGVGGIGMKPPDLVGVWACSNCHDAIDGRNQLGKYDTEILEALCRTLNEVSREIG